MQLAHWITTTPIPSLESVIPPWMGLRFSVFPTVETLLAQAVSALLIVGSYILAIKTTTARGSAISVSPRYVYFLKLSNSEFLP